MCKQNNDRRVGDRQQLVKCFYIHFISSFLFQRISRVEDEIGRGLEVEGRALEIEGRKRGSRVASRGARVACQESRVIGRG